MPNFNDAKITSLYVNADSAVSDIEDNAPNAPGGGKFDVTLEMVAGEGVAGPYKLITSCTDLTDPTAATAALTPGGLLNGAGSFATAPEWKKVPPLGLTQYQTFNHSVKVGPAPAPGHVYQYTAALHSDNGQVVSIRQSEPFILL